VLGGDARRRRTARRARGVRHCSLVNSPTKRGAAFWVLVALGGLGTCCGLPLIALAAVGLSSEDPATPGEGAEQSDGDAAERPAEADDFVYHSPNGLSYVAPSSVAAEGVNVTLIGEWRDDHRNITLRLKEGGRYELTNSGGVLVGEKISNAVAYGSGSAERGAWSLEGSTLSFTPEGRRLSGSVGRKRLDTEEVAAEAPRAWSVVGVTIEYTPEGQSAPRQRPGLRIRGPSPAWYYPSGAWDLVLRSAPWSG
jgi:hypothetical protein